MPCLLLLGSSVVAAPEPELVNIRAVDPTIVVDLRYASARNIGRRPFYAPDMPALVRPAVAQALAKAQETLRQRGYGLKIWDAYRPKAAHDQLWELTRKMDYVADPASGGSLHTWGVAVDATMVDKKGRELKMPTDFDDFTPAAWLRYLGDDQLVRRHLLTLQSAMARAGFLGLRTEWWHFIVKDWKSYRAVEEPTLSAPAPARAAASSISSASAPHLPRSR
ncbi:MAG: M15 family metallopeptidase [Chthoniobacterales bacterium]